VSKDGIYLSIHITISNPHLSFYLSIHLGAIKKESELELDPGTGTTPNRSNKPIFVGGGCGGWEGIYYLFIIYLII
jgi:hypothetical protein